MTAMTCYDFKVADNYLDGNVNMSNCLKSFTK